MQDVLHGERPWPSRGDGLLRLGDGDCELRGLEHVRRQQDDALGRVDAQRGGLVPLQGGLDDEGEVHHDDLRQVRVGAGEVAHQRAEVAAHVDDGVEGAELRAVAADEDGAFGVGVGGTSLR